MINIFAQDDKNDRLEHEFAKHVELHKVRILLSYYEQEIDRLDNNGVTLLDFMIDGTPSERAMVKIIELQNNPELFESTYLTVWNRVADILP